MMMNGAAQQQHYVNNRQLQPIPLSQVQPLIGSSAGYGYQSNNFNHHQYRKKQLTSENRSYISNTSSSGVGSSSSSSSSNRHYYGQNLSLPTVNECYTCYERITPEQLMQVACGHKLCQKCLNVPLSNGTLMSTFDKCPICSAISLFSNNNIRDAFNSQTSSPIFGNSSSTNYNIWEPLPLNNDKSHGLNSSYPNIFQQNVKMIQSSKQLNKIYNDKNLIDQKCTNCDEEQNIVSYCVDCIAYYCSECLLAHTRVKLTKNHQITYLTSKIINGMTVLSYDTTSSRSQSDSASIKYDSESPNSCTNNSIISLTSCPNHDMNYIVKCITCDNLNLCVRCLQQHSKHEFKIIQTENQNYSILLKKLINDSKNVYKSMEDSVDGIKKMEEKIDKSIKNTKERLHSIYNLYIKSLEDKKNELYKKIEKIHYSKISTLKLQNDMLLNKMNVLSQNIKLYENLCINYSDTNDEVLLEYLYKLINIHSDKYVPIIPTTNDFIELKLNNNILNELNKFGNIITGLDPKMTYIIGTNYKNVTCNNTLIINIQMNDTNGDPITKELREQGGEFIATLYGPLANGQSAIQYADIIDHDNGICSLSFTPKKVGKYRLNITYCQISINGCPAEINVNFGRSYLDAKKYGPKFSFGKEGSGDGELSRPWGICCDLKNRIIVADRSNHRIQIFDNKGQFLLKFGKMGNSNGEFNRPAGVCVNSSNQIIVADKDNHRIQIFYEDGSFSHTFGNRGSSRGCFNYPWDVACNKRYEIAVTDTRNHRVQIFTNEGALLRTCSIAGGMKGLLKSPRGISFLTDDDLIISDFNAHQIATINKKNEVKYFGSGGIKPGCFHRPQGLAIDSDGLILVCDSRSNRIQVLNINTLCVVGIFGSHAKHLPKNPLTQYNTSLINKMDTYSLEYIECDDDEKMDDPLEHPMDITVSPEGLVYVVDFGNNCIRVY